MNNFRNILYVSDGIGDETAALKQAFSIARNNEAKIDALVVCPSVPETFGEYEKKLHDVLAAQVTDSAKAARQSLNLMDNEFPFSIEVETGNMPAMQVVHHVLKGGYDLVIKEASFQDGGKGFRAMDMDLLRKCPCPVWLTHPIEMHRNEIRVAVAIDPNPEVEEQVNLDLSLKLLKVARALADECNGTLNVFSFWDLAYENTIRHSPFLSMKKEEVDNIVSKAKSDSRSSLDSIIKKTAITGDIKVFHERGEPDKLIPQFLEQERIDILVMGTVARVGVSAFVMGNTAENVLQSIKCSLLALKPNGYVSPVKA